VQKGLDYLARQQFEDGHWEGEGGNHPVAMTGMAGLEHATNQCSVTGIPHERK
jgi:hypothetical protein